MKETQQMGVFQQPDRESIFCIKIRSHPLRFDLNKIMQGCITLFPKGYFSDVEQIRQHPPGKGIYGKGKEE
jgi:hypothetical protein